jgi:hypothetical protein
MKSSQKEQTKVGMKKEASRMVWVAPDSPVPPTGQSIVHRTVQLNGLLLGKSRHLQL